MNANEYADTIRLYHNGESPSGGLKFFFSARQARALGLVPGRIYDIRRVGVTQLELVPVDLVVEAPEGSMAWIHGLDPWTPCWRVSGVNRGRFHASLACAQWTERQAIAQKRGKNALSQTKLGAALAAHVRPCSTCWVPAPPILQPDAPVASSTP